MHYIAQMRSRLLEDDKVRELVGQYGVYTDYPWQSVDEPYVLLILSDEETFPTVSNLCKTGVHVARVRVIIIADTRPVAFELYSACKNSLRGFSSADSQNRIQGIDEQSGQQWEVLEPVDGGDKRLFLCESMYVVPYQFLT